MWFSCLYSALAFTQGLMAAFMTVLGGRLYHSHFMDEDTGALGQCPSRPKGPAHKRRWWQLLFKPQEGKDRDRIHRSGLFFSKEVDFCLLKGLSIHYPLGGKEVSPTSRRDISNLQLPSRLAFSQAGVSRPQCLGPECCFLVHITAFLWL